MIDRQGNNYDNQYLQQEDNIEIPIRGRPKKRGNPSQEINMQNFYNQHQFNNSLSEHKNMAQEEYITGLNGSHDMDMMFFNNQDEMSMLDFQPMNEKYIPPHLFQQNKNTANLGHINHKKTPMNSTPNQKTNDSIYNNSIDSNIMIKSFQNDQINRTSSYNRQMSAGLANKNNSMNLQNSNFQKNIEQNYRIATPQSDGNFIQSKKYSLEQPNGNNYMCKIDSNFGNKNQINDPKNHMKNIGQGYAQSPYNMPYNVMENTGPASQRTPVHPCALPNDFFMSGNPWLNRKKRKNNPLLWQYMQQNKDFHPGLVHPSRYSSVDYIQGIDRSQKMFIGTVKRPQTFPDKNTPNYTVLPLFLNSTSFYEGHMQNQEFEKIGKIFLDKTKNLDYENVTVQQLKILMKEFGLNHTGKKVDLIDRVKTSIITLKKKLQEKTDPQGSDYQPKLIQPTGFSKSTIIPSVLNASVKTDPRDNKNTTMSSQNKFDMNNGTFDDQNNLDYLFF